MTSCRSEQFRRMTVREICECVDSSGRPALRVVMEKK